MFLLKPFIQTPQRRAFFAMTTAKRMNTPTKSLPLKQVFATPLTTGKTVSGNTHVVAQIKPKEEDHERSHFDFARIYRRFGVGSVQQREKCMYEFLEAGAPM